MQHLRASISRDEGLPGGDILYELIHCIGRLVESVRWTID